MTLKQYAKVFFYLNIGCIPLGIALTLMPPIQPKNIVFPVLNVGGVVLMRRVIKNEE